MKINVPFLITQYDGSGAYGGSGGLFSAASAISAIPPHAGFTKFHTGSDHYGNVVTHTHDDNTLSPFSIMQFSFTLHRGK